MSHTDTAENGDKIEVSENAIEYEEEEEEDYDEEEDYYYNYYDDDELACGPSTENSLSNALTEKEQLILAENLSRMEQRKCNEELYCATMKRLIFGTIQFYGPNHEMRIPYHFASSLKADSGEATANWTTRLAKEIKSLHNLLPISANSSIFVRACEERLDVMKVLIIGPAETPYANGCFEFDVFFPTNYPNEPMRVNLETTGHNTVRFNPNLYECGNVCLSILNTWQGSPEERWNPSKSTLLQVLVSIQAMVFVEEPFFNEPGFETMRNTPTGEKESRDYNAKIRQMCLRWAMYQQLQNPPKAFADVIECHFWLKRDEICAQIEGWIADFEEQINNGKMPTKHLDVLKMEFEKLKEKFSSMKRPDHISFDKRENVKDEKVGGEDDDEKEDDIDGNIEEEKQVEDEDNDDSEKDDEKVGEGDDDLMAKAYNEICNCSIQ